MGEGLDGGHLFSLAAARFSKEGDRANDVPAQDEPQEGSWEEAALFGRWRLSR